MRPRPDPPTLARRTSRRYRTQLNSWFKEKHYGLPGSKPPRPERARHDRCRCRWPGGVAASLSPPLRSCSRHPPAASPFPPPRRPSHPSRPPSPPASAGPGSPKAGGGLPCSGTCLSSGSPTRPLLGKPATC